jgi:hypothetical protein
MARPLQNSHLMETENLKKENDKIDESIRELQRELDQDILLGRFYGMEQKIRNIQKTFSLSLRV